MTTPTVFGLLGSRGAPNFSPEQGVLLKLAKKKGSDFTEEFPKNSVHLVSSANILLVAWTPKNSGWFLSPLPPTQKKKLMQTNTLTETNIASENSCFEDFLLSSYKIRPIFRCELLVSGSVGKKTRFLLYCQTSLFVWGDLFANLLHLQKHRRGRGLLALARSNGGTGGPCSFHVSCWYFYQPSSIEASKPLQQNTILYC